MFEVFWSFIRHQECPLYDFSFLETFEEEFTVVFGQLGSVHTFLIIDPRCAAAFFIQMNSAHTVNEDSDRKAITELQCKFN